MHQVVGESIARQRMNMILAGAVAAIAALLAAVGIYGVMSSSVSRRAQEIGIRTALGEGPSLAGISVWITRLISGLLFGVRPRESWVFLAAAALLAGVAIAACWLPAWRASRIHPVITLRESSGLFADRLHANRRVH